MSRDMAIALALGAVSGVCVLTVALGSVGSMILTYLAPLPLFAAGLMLGVPKLALAASVGVAACLLLGLAMLVSFAVAVAGPVIWLVRQALLFRVLPDGSVEWYPPGRLVSWLAAIAGGYLVAAAVWYSGAPGGLPGVLQPQLAIALDQFGGIGSVPPGELAAAIAQVMPAVLAAIWMLVIAVNGMLAQGLAVRFGRNIRPSPAMDQIELPVAMVAALGVAVVASLLPGTVGFIGESLTVVLAMPFLFQGLGVVHALARRTVAPTAMLVVFYVLLLLFGGLVLVVAALGLVEQWARLRRRMAGSGGGQEDE